MTQVSVVIPVYNIEGRLEQCLDSVTGQSLEQTQIICVDDGSTDGSAAILARYAARDRRVRVLTQPNGGPGAARNAGLALAEGEYVIFLDADDWFETGFLESMVNRAEQTGADVTICRAVEFDDRTGQAYASDWMLKSQYLPGKDTFAPGEMADCLFQFSYGWPWDKLYRLDFVRREGLLFPKLPHSEDLVFVFESLAAAKTIAVLDRTLIHHRVNRAASVSNSRGGDPTAAFEAFRLVRTDLQKRGLAALYERSFLCWAAEFLVWHVSGLEEASVRRRYFAVLRREWLPELGFDRHPPAFYHDRVVYGKYLLARYAPYPVFRLVWRAYKAAKKREAV